MDWVVFLPVLRSILCSYCYYFPISKHSLLVMTLTALIKLSDRFGDAYFERINNMLKPYQTSCVLQAQQRSCEYAELLQDDYSMIREQLLDRMPPLDIDNAKARRKEDEEGDDDDYDDDFDDDDGDDDGNANLHTHTQAGP